MGVRWSGAESAKLPFCRTHNDCGRQVQVRRRGCPEPLRLVRIAEPYLIGFRLFDKRLLDFVEPAPAAARTASPTEDQATFRRRMHSWLDREQGTPGPAPVLERRDHRIGIGGSDGGQFAPFAQGERGRQFDQTIIEQRDQRAGHMPRQSLDLGTAAAAQQSGKLPDAIADRLGLRELDDLAPYQQAVVSARDSVGRGRFEFGLAILQRDPYRCRALEPQTRAGPK
jgi:hypothetical protein